MIQGTAVEKVLMPFNLPGTLVPFYALLNPRLLLPSLAVVRLSPPILYLTYRKSSSCSATFATLTLPP